MKKSKLRNIIKESIKELMMEQMGTYYTMSTLQDAINDINAGQQVNFRYAVCLDQATNNGYFDNSGGTFSGNQSGCSSMMLANASVNDLTTPLGGLSVSLSDAANDPNSGYYDLVFGSNYYDPCNAACVNYNSNTSTGSSPCWTCINGYQYAKNWPSGGGNTGYCGGISTNPSILAGLTPSFTGTVDPATSSIAAPGSPLSGTLMFWDDQNHAQLAGCSTGTPPPPPPPPPPTPPNFGCAIMTAGNYDPNADGCETPTGTADPQDASCCTAPPGGGTNFGLFPPSEDEAMVNLTPADPLTPNTPFMGDDDMDKKQFNPRDKEMLQRRANIKKRR